MEGGRGGMRYREAKQVRCCGGGTGNTREGKTARDRKAGSHCYVPVGNAPEERRSRTKPRISNCATTRPKFDSGGHVIKSRSTWISAVSCIPQPAGRLSQCTIQFTLSAAFVAGGMSAPVDSEITACCKKIFHSFRKSKAIKFCERRRAKLKSQLRKVEQCVLCSSGCSAAKHQYN